MLYVDDGAFEFESSTNIEKGITILSDHFAWFSPKMHIGMKEIPQRLNPYFYHLQVSSTQEL